jgi:hypothetical protein
MGPTRRGGRRLRGHGQSPLEKARPRDDRPGSTRPTGLNKRRDQLDEQAPGAIHGSKEQGAEPFPTRSTKN